MEESEKREARRWLARQLAWETTLDRLVRDWEKEQDLPVSTAAKRVTASQRRARASGLPRQKPAA